YRRNIRPKPLIRQTAMQAEVLRPARRLLIPPQDNLTSFPPQLGKVLLFPIGVQLIPMLEHKKSLNKTTGEVKTEDLRSRGVDRIARSVRDLDLRLRVMAVLRINCRRCRSLTARRRKEHCNTSVWAGKGD